MKINASEYLEFVIKLSERFANMKGVILKLVPLKQEIEIATFPFLFENLLYLCIDHAIKNSGEEKKISISVEKMGDRVRFCFSGINSENRTDKTFLSNSEGINKELGSKIINEETSNFFLLDVPERLTA